MSVFHPFVRLPAELRLQIWQAACFRPSPSDRRIQYVTAQDEETVVPLPCNWHQSRQGISRQGISSGDKNRSAYLIDGGLWKACKESRDVIAQYSHFHDWVRILKQACVNYDNFEYYPADWAGGEKSSRPAIIKTCEGEEECCMLVYPAIDIFCIQVDEQYTRERSQSGPELEMSLIRDNKQIEDIFMAEVTLQNIALEFDGSWLVDIPASISSPTDTNPTREYFRYLLLKHCEYRHGIDALWIIDKETKWFDKDFRHHDTVYWDCDTEYVEVDWHHVVTYCNGGRWCSASGFMWRIKDWLEDFSDVYDSDEPRPKDMFRLLVRRDNEMQDPRIGGEWEFWHDHRYGWGLYVEADEKSDEELDEEEDTNASSHESTLEDN
ncbi:hypothetical protein FPOAC2_10452 [Fusarium poae]|jgi:hypothetical protein|uniref:2EXR domain-containing protein n=1 Tax=Fusarium poae TaxID=36050 RepID=A0A1B8AB32_FUSPO|nr:hypothetical protein FPOAC1_010172 [Fusarium poae]KAG8665377.1 hypothetical protein FPOAC1_010172 [Fusarium poae]OBS17682.1 hypothetical protein FPOA_09415 [Fusarium poae]